MKGAAWLQSSRPLQLPILARFPLSAHHYFQGGATGGGFPPSGAMDAHFSGLSSEIPCVPLSLPTIRPGREGNQTPDVCTQPCTVMTPPGN